MSQRVPQSRPELEQHLDDHLSFLRNSADAYDLGQDGEAKRLAVSIRVLLHDTANSASLLGQLDRLNGNFLSTAIPHDESNLLTHGGLIMMGGGKYLAMLDDVPIKRWMPFQDWWNEIVFVDDRKERLSRKQLVLAVANQDGGAHVDPKLNETYARLSRHNSLGWVVTDGKTSKPIPKPERAAIRQIAHEVLVSCVPDYKKKVEHKVDIITGGAMFHKGSSPPPLPKQQKVGRNDPCPCGSGRKYKKCHGNVAI
jgi:hypothetical protein